MRRQRIHKSISQMVSSLSLDLINSINVIIVAKCKFDTYHKKCVEILENWVHFDMKHPLKFYLLYVAQTKKELEETEKEQNNRNQLNVCLKNGN